MTNEFKDYLLIQGYSELTAQNYSYAVDKFIRYLQEQGRKTDIIHLCNVEEADIYNYLAYINENSLANKRFAIFALKKFFRYLLKSNYNDFIFKNIKLFDHSRKLPYILSTQEIQLVLNYYKDTRNKLIIYLLYFNGIRLGELLSITKSNIQGNIVRINGKTGERIIYLNSNTKQLLDEYITECTTEYLFPFSRRLIETIVEKVFGEYHIKGSCHTLRHTSATHLYQRTNDILLVKEFLGHKSIEATQIYTQIYNREVKEAIEKNPLASFGVKNEN